MANLLEKVEVGEEFTPIPQEKVDAALRGEKINENPDQEKGTVSVDKEKVEEVKQEVKVEEKKEEVKAPGLPLDEKGNVKFSDDMISEIRTKAKEVNPDASDEDLNRIIDEQKLLINNQFGNQNKASESKKQEEKSASENVQPAIDDLVKSKTEGKYNSLSDLIASHNEMQAKSDFKFIHPSIKKLNEALNQGANLDESGMLNFLKAQTVDYDQMDHYDLISEIYRLEEPGISDDEIYENMNKFHVILNNNEEELNEMVENGDITENKINALMSEYDRMGNNAYRKLKEKQEEMAVSLAPSAEELEEQQKAINAENQKIIDSFNKQVEEKISNFTTDKIQVGFDKDQNPVFFDYSIDEAKKEAIKAAASNINDFIANRFIDKETGAVDFQKLFSDLNFWLDRDKILASAVARTANQTKKETATLFNNYSFLEQSRSGIDRSVKSEADQITDKLVEIHSLAGRR